MALLSVNSDGSRPTRYEIGDGGFDFTASPDGRRLAYQDASGGVSIAGIDGSGARRVAADGESPAWSPGGTRLVFRHSGMLHVVRSDGRRVRPLRGSDVLGDLSWSPSGRLIAFVGSGPARYRDATSVFVISPRGGRPRRVYTPPFDYGHVSGLDWSPDGRRLVLEVRESVPECMGCGGEQPQSDQRARGRVGINVVGLDGRPLRRLTAIGESPVWSPDGRWIAFRGGATLWVMRARGGPHNQVLSFESRGGATGPTWLSVPE
jgi:Tol biopolymer transport system component